MLNLCGTTYVHKFVYKANDILRILFDSTVQCLLYSLLFTDISTTFLAGEIQKAQTTPHEIIIRRGGRRDTGPGAVIRDKNKDNGHRSATEWEEEQESGNPTIRIRLGVLELSLGGWLNWTALDWAKGLMGMWRHLLLLAASFSWATAKKFCGLG